MDCRLDPCDFLVRSFRLRSVSWCAIALVWCVLLAGCGSGQSSSATATSSSTGSGTPASTPGTSAPTSGASGTGTSGGGGSQVLSSPFVYVSETSQSFSSGNAGGSFSGLIEAFVLNGSSGVLSPLPGSPFSTNYSTGGDMAFAPHGAFAYVLAESYPAGTCCIGPTSILVYALDPASGTPTLKQALATTGASEVSRISVHPSGNFIYVTPYNDNSGNAGIGAFSVQSDGTVAFVGFTQAQSEGAATISPNGTFLYTNSDGAPIGNWPSTQACGPVNENLSAFSISSTTGALTPVAGSPFIFQRQVCDVGHAPQYLTKQSDPSGQRLFVIDSGNATVTVFAIDPSTGALTLLPGTSTDGSVAGFYSSTIDPMGRFLYIGSIISSFTGFSLAASTATGTLPVLTGMPVQVTASMNDEGSTTMAIDSSGSYLFSNQNDYTSAFSCCGADALVEFQVNPTTGALTQLPSTPITLAGTASKIVAAPPQ